ncbi:cytochrome P450 [Streptomyces sp. FIT100]|uniref:cytochrome P450 n=1 Tax=Streptomyces sp. FIT100 TaxID=2837956 RepID=UPI0021C98706|nr:cytochrome P450 [Streptomyces sp. FIT100]UUN29849.1 cytochrome P450 [Streptomyces sp. FIT100]
MPGGHPFLGHALQLRSRPLEFVQALRTYGDIVAFRLGPRDAYAVNHPDLIRRMLTTEAKSFAKGRMFEKGRLVARNGLFTSEGDFHLRQRRIIQPLLRRAHIQQYTVTMREIAHARVETWRDGQEIRMDRELFDVALDTVTRVLFSTRIGDHGAAAVYRSLPVLLEGLGRRAVAPIDLLDKLPTVMNYRFARALSQMRRVIEHIISEYRSRGADADADAGTADLLAALLAARDEETGEGMSDEQVYDEVVTMLIAGTETTAGALSWACYLLSRHPRIQQRLQAELEEQLGERDVVFEDLGKLRFLQQVIAETLRLHPSTWMLMRSPVADVELGGHLLPVGSTVLFSIYALQRDPSLYPRPDEFDPDRWAPERAALIHRDAYIPFGAGIRGCAGEQFARAEMAIILGVILRQFILCPGSGPPARPIVRLIPMPSAMPLIVHRRPRGPGFQEAR